MLDINNLLKCEDQKRKAVLLKSLKTTFESLMFDHSTRFTSNFSFNGNLSLFCKNIIEILLDGLIKSAQVDSLETLWNLITSILFDPSSKETSSPKNEFKKIFENLNFNDPESILPDWILNSLRNKTLLSQINFIFQSEFKEIFISCYDQNALMLDEEFTHDFLIFIKAYETSNFKILKECRLNLYKILNNSAHNSKSSSRADLDSLSSSPYFVIESPLENRNGHRRIHSYPIVQKFEIGHKFLESFETVLTEDSIREPIRIEHFMDERKSDRESPKESEDQMLDAEIFDLINELQINSDCSPLDKENSHFLMADLAIAAAELIKTQEIPDSKTTAKTSSPININNFKPLEIKQEQNLSSRSQSFSKSFKISYNKSISRRSSSLSDLYSFKDENLPNLFSRFKQLKLKEEKNNSQSDIFKFSAESYNQDSKLSPSLMSNSVSFYNQSIDQSQINEEGFDIIDTKSRSRKFSWDINDLIDSAGAIATRLIKNLLNVPHSRVPTLRDFEFFLSFLNYEELMREFHFNSSLNTKNKKKSLSLIEEKPSNLSASSIYLSHLEPGNSKSDSLSKASISPVSFFLNDSSFSYSSSYLSVKSAVLNVGSKRQNGELMFSGSFSPTGRIIGDESWAPVREQLILNLTRKVKRAEQMEKQHYRCADCGIKIKDMNKNLKSFNYCEYFCKYFCRCCHTNQTSYIPAYVVYLLDFRTSFQVSKKAKIFLDKIFEDPIIPLENLNPSLFQDRSNMFSKFKKIRTKLNCSKSYITTCRYAQNLESDLNTKFEDFIINDTQIYSVDILFKIKKTNYYEQLKYFFLRVAEHIKSCELCSQKGYICGICDKKDLLYPFELEKVAKCPNCLACYHRACLKRPDNCPRCLRLKSRTNNK